MKWMLLMLSYVLSSCVAIDESADESEPIDEEVGEAAQALCIYPQAPLSSFSPNVERSLIGDWDVVRSDGFPAASGCAVYSMGVEPGEGGIYMGRVEYETVGTCAAADPSAQIAFIWRRQGFGMIAVWSKVAISMTGSDLSSAGRCRWSGSAAIGSGSYSRVIVAGRGAQPDGSPVAPMLQAFETSSSTGFSIYAPPPPICPAPSVLLAGDAQVSLDGATTQATYSGLPTSICDFVKLKVDANPDRAHEAFVEIDATRPQDVDVDSMQIYVWTTTGAAPGWVRRQLNPYLLSGSGAVIRAQANLGNGNANTEVIVAARALKDDGTPVTSIALKVQE
jgi:hypothetical protein